MSDQENIGDIELLAGSPFPGQWIPTGLAGKWEMNPAGALVQNTPVGNRQAGTGAILSQKTPFSGTVYELKLACRPGSQHQIGIVFNLLNEQNFCAFCIDQHSKESEGYSLLAFAMNKGDYDVISKQNYKGTLPETVNLTLRQTGSNLALVFNNTVAYVWENMLLSGKRIGLYSYKNKDAAFLSLKQSQHPAESTNTETKSGEVQPTNGIETPNTQPNQTKEQTMSNTPLNGITEFLGIRQPASKTEIEFTEVFTVPLDSFYSNLYQNTNLDSVNQPVIVGPAEVQVLDLRIKRWYRDLKMIREDIVSAVKDLVRKQARVTDAEKNLGDVGLSDAQYAPQEGQLNERRADARVALRGVNALRDKEGLLLREIRVNGYVVLEKTTIPEIISLGYNFAIGSRGVAGGMYNPVKYDQGIDLADDSAWKAAEQKLYHQLFDTTAISKDGASQYQSAKDKLASFDTCQPLVDRANQLTAEIPRLEELIPPNEAALADLKKVQEDWQSDKQNLEDHKKSLANVQNSSMLEIGSFNASNGSRAVKPAIDWLISSGTVGTFSDHPLHPAFINIGSRKRVKLNQLVTETYFGSTKTNGSTRQTPFPSAFREVLIREGVDVIDTYHLVVALYYPELNRDWYHRSQTAFTYTYYPAGQEVPPPYNEGYPVDIPEVYVPNPSPTIETFNSDQNLIDFLDSAIDICRRMIEKLDVDIEAAKVRSRELAGKVEVCKQSLEDLKQNGLKRERAKFLETWNDPATNMTTPISTAVHYPDEDPLAEFLYSVSGHGDENASPVDTYFFAPTPDGFYNQNGLSLVEFMKSHQANTSVRDIICVFPVFDSAGSISGEMVKTVRNPQKPNTNNIPSLPTIKFVESYRTEVGWLGYGVGELSHSFNLFPGEAKELVVEKTTKLSTKLSETSTSEETISTHLTSSFEDSLQNELSVGEKAANESSSMAKHDSTQSASSEDVSSQQFDVNYSTSASAGIDGLFEGSAKFGAGANFNSSSKRNSAFATSQSAEEKRASNQSKDILAKDISNAVRKVASETSQNNKLAFTAVSSREYEESTTNREVIKLQNPNVGKTVNYNFFQVQNLYGVTTKLIDVQIVVDSGVEMVKGTGINDIRVYDLEEFGKIYANSEGTDRAAALASIIARQVFKHYGDFLPGVTSGNGSVGVPDGANVNKEMLEVLNFSSEDSETVLKEQIDKIKTALDYLKGLPFQLREKVLSQEATVAVNCAAYHVEAQLGFLPATESYLEDRREIETDKQRALVEQMKAQTKAGVFFQELPEGITSLNFSGTKLDK